MQDRETGSVFVSVCVWYVSMGGMVYNIICQEYSLGCQGGIIRSYPRIVLARSQGAEGTNSADSHIVSPCFSPSPAHTCWTVARLDFMILPKYL